MGPGNGGRLEVYHNGSWGTVCDDGWNIKNSHVACRQLGYLNAVASYRLDYSDYGTGKIWLDDVRCDSTESSLFSCKHNGWGIHDCGHYEDVVILCQSTAGGKI